MNPKIPLAGHMVPMHSVNQIRTGKGDSVGSHALDFRIGVETEELPELRFLDCQLCRMSTGTRGGARYTASYGTCADLCYLTDSPHSQCAPCWLWERRNKVSSECCWLLHLLRHEPRSGSHRRVGYPIQKSREITALQCPSWLSVGSSSAPHG